jgi:capsid portal protein
MPVIKARIVYGSAVPKGLHDAVATPSPSSGLVKREAARLANPKNKYDLVDLPFDVATVSRTWEWSSELRPCLDVMVQNIHGFGQKFTSIFDAMDVEPSEAQKKEVVEEWTRLENFINTSCFVNEEPVTLTRLRCITGFAVEAVGYAFWEISLDGDDNISAFSHMPVVNVRATKLEDEPTRWTRVVRTRKPDGTFVINKVLGLRRFRRFCQVNERGEPIRWFRQWGDPREYDYETGSELGPKPSKGSRELDHWMARRASSVFMWRIHDDTTPFGKPRFLGNLITIDGDRTAEEVNYATLQDDCVPAVVLLVNGQDARVTGETQERLDEFFDQSRAKKRNRGRCLVIEGSSEREGIEIGSVQLEMKPLSSVQMKDSMFQHYQRTNADKIRSNFRFHPIFIGRAVAEGRQSIDIGRKLSDQQIFAPERQAFDDAFNTNFLPHLGARYHSFQSNGPDITDPQDMIRVLLGAERSGALTPRIGRIVLERLFNQQLPSSKKIELDYPASFQLAEIIAGGNLRRTEVRLNAPTGAAKAVELQKELEPDADENQRNLMEEIRREFADELDRLRQEVEALKHNGGV